jgi:hypothetical protein
MQHGWAHGHRYSALLSMVMTEHACTHTQGLVAHTDVFSPTAGGAQAMAADMGVPFLGRIPLDPALSLAGEGGSSIFAEGADAVVAARPALQAIVDALVEATSARPADGGVEIDPQLAYRIHLGF